MREIKFRIWHGGNMYYMDKGNHLTLSFFSEGIPWGLYESATEARLVTGDPNAILNTPGTIMQWVGLYDKNGKVFYEGDIIKKDSLKNEGYYVVRYDLENASYDGFKPFDAQNWTFLSDQCEIIGNIYQNPELIEREAKI